MLPLAGKGLRSVLAAFHKLGKK